VRGLICQADVAGSPDRLLWIKEWMKDCPHVTTLLHRGDDPGRMVLSLAVPRDKVWWAMELGEKSSLIGVDEVKVSTFTESLPTEVLLPDYSPRVPVPCGADCRKCPRYGVRCKGCRVSQFTSPTTLTEVWPARGGEETGSMSDIAVHLYGV